MDVREQRVRQSMAYGRCPLTETVKDVPGQTVQDVLGLDIQSTDAKLG
jgi:hypothetical protein